MKVQGKKAELLGSAPIPRALLSMGIPTMIGMMISAVYNLADAYFVGGLGTAQTGAISVTYPLGQAVVGLGLLFGNGAASYIARLLGQGNIQKAGSTASTALYGGLAAGCVFILGSLLFFDPILRGLGATEGILPYARSYGRIYLVSLIFNVFNVTMNSIVTSEGAARTTMCAMLAGALLNLVLDPLFIYRLGLGVAGAALATGISQMASSLLYLIYIFRQKSLFRFRIRECCFSGELLSEILKIGIPTLLFQLLGSLSLALINLQAAKYGDSVIAAMGVVNRIVSLGTLMVFGFLKGFQPLAGYNYGAGQTKRLQEAIRTAICWTTVFCVLLGLSFLLVPTAIISLFTKGDAVFLQAGKTALRANGLSIMLFGFHTVYASLFLALGKARKGLLLGVCRQGICFLPLILVLPAVLGQNGILYAQPIADGLTALITAKMASKAF